MQDEYLVRTPDLSGFALGAKVVHLGGCGGADAAADGGTRGDRRGAQRRARRGARRALRRGAGCRSADADPDFPLSDSVRLVREPGRFALGRLLLVEQGAPGEAIAAAASDLRVWGATRQIGEFSAGFGCLAVPIRDAAGVLGAPRT